MAEGKRVESIPQEEIENTLQSRYQFLRFWTSLVPVIGINIFADLGKIYGESEVDEVRCFIQDFYEKKGVGFMLEVERPIKDPGVIIYHVMNLEMIYPGEKN